MISAFQRRPGVRFGWVVGGLLAAVLLATSAAPPAYADPGLPSESELYPALPVPIPANDPFYADPADFEQFGNGDIIRRREVTAWFLGVPWPPVRTEQLLYRTTDAHDRPIATATTVMIPGIPWLGPGPRPLISYQEAIDSMGSVCNPSFTIRAGIFKETRLLYQFLAEGMAVSIPDFDGKTMALVSEGEGRAVLDGMRAARRAGLGLENSGIGMWGYSGGGNATAQAAEQHAGYAPELPVKGVAAGGVPADKSVVFPWSARGTGLESFVAWAVLMGAARSYPELVSLDRILDADGLRVAEDLSNRCVGTFLASSIFKPMVDYLKEPQSLNDPGLQEVLHRTSMGSQGRIPDMPIFLWHATTDQLLPMSEGVLDTMLHSYCAAGADLRFHAVPATEHLGAELIGYLPSAIWLTAVLAGGDPGPTTC